MEMYEYIKMWAGGRISESEKDILCRLSCCYVKECDCDNVNVEKLVHMGLIYYVQEYDKCYLGLTEIGGLVRRMLRE